MDKSQNSLTIELSKVRMRVFLTIGALILSVSSLFAGLEWIERRNIASNFVDMARGAILLGDYRKVLMEASILTKNGAYFSEISFHDRGGNIVFNTGIDAAIISRFDHSVYFDRDASSPIGRFTFGYSLSNLFTLTIITLFMGLAVGSYWLRSLSAKLLTKFENDIEASRNEMLATYSRHIAHDLRAPLVAIERLLNLPHEAKLIDEAPKIRVALNRLYSLAESFRYADLEGIVKRENSRMDFSEIEILSQKAKENSLELITKNYLSVGCIMVDRKKFDRACENLVSNALDFASSKVEIEFISSLGDLVVRVIDDGPGVCPSILPQLFQRGTTFGKVDGTGLGLAYVRQIMRGHGGDVSYRRENGRTIFECILPNAIASEKDQIVENSATFEIQIAQKIVRKVAFCLEPQALSNSILAKLSSLKTDDFLFIRERDEANIVVSNVEEIMFEVLESDEQEYISVSQFKGDEELILEVLRLRFNLI